MVCDLNEGTTVDYGNRRNYGYVLRQRPGNGLPNHDQQSARA